MQIVFRNKWYKKKKTPEEFHIFVILFAFTGIRTDLPTEGGFLIVGFWKYADYEF